MQEAQQTELQDREGPEDGGVVPANEAGSNQRKGTAKQPVGGARGKAKEEGSDRHDLADQLDRLSLTQALMDAEIATSRAIDLTERLVDARQTITSLRAELEALRIEYAQYQAEEEQMRSSAAFRLAERIWQIRNALGI